MKIRKAIILWIARIFRVNVDSLVMWRNPRKDSPSNNTHTAILIQGDKATKPRPETAFYCNGEWRVYNSPMGFDAWQVGVIKGWYEIPKP